MGRIRDILKYVTNGEVLVVGLISAWYLFAGAYSYFHSNYLQKLAQLEFVNDCLGRSPKYMQEKVKTPIEALWLIKPYGENTDCVSVAGFVQGLLKSDYPTKTLYIESNNFTGKENIRGNFHVVCTFEHKNKIGAIDSKVGYITPRKNIGEVVKVIEKEYKIGKSESYRYMTISDNIETSFEKLNEGREIELP